MGKIFSKLINSLKNRKKGIGFLAYNVLGNLFTLILNFYLPFIWDIETYGYFVLIFSIHNIAIAFFTFGLEETILKYTIQGEFKYDSLFKVFTSWLVLITLFLPLVIIIVYYLNTAVKFEFVFKNIIIVILSAVFISLQRILLSFFIATAFIKKYGILFVFNKFVQFLLILGAAIFFKENSTVLILAFMLQGICNLVYVGVNLIRMKVQIVNYPKKAEVLDMIKFTLPLSINTIGNWGYNYGFNVFLSPLLTLAQLGVLNIFTQFSTIIRMLLNALNNGYIPSFYKEYALNFKNSVNNYFKYISLNTVIIIIPTIIIAIIYKYQLQDIEGNYTLFNLFLFFTGTFFYTYKSIGTSFLILESKTIYISVITVFTSITNILLGLFLTKHFGFIGCVFSVSLGYIFQAIIFNLGLLKKYFIKI
jgi:O-antigen/teichoic acid export membrane protein